MVSDKGSPNVIISDYYSKSQPRAFPKLQWLIVQFN
jgi:hypothetical protein